MIMLPIKFKLLLVIGISCTTLSSSGSAETISKFTQKRSTANLEYVMRVLEEQGRLGEVDSNLLKRIQATIKGSHIKDESHFRSESGKNIVLSSSPTVSALDHAMIRKQQLFGNRSQNRSPQNISPFSRRKQQLLGGECQALKTENSILKQKLLATQSQKHQDRRRGLEVHGQELWNKIQDDSSPFSNILQPVAGPLDRLLAVASEKEEKEDIFGNIVSSILITPTPTITTILRTTSFATTTTVTLTREIGIYFHGKRIPTHILDTEVQVQTVTSTLSTTVEITPTPTWQFITITPTVTPSSLTSTSPPPEDINDLLAKKKKEQERQDLIDRIKSLNNPKPEKPRSIGGVKAEVIEIPKVLDSFEPLKKYIQQIRNLKTEETPTIVAEPLKSIPSTSVSTIYISGSVPGEYSTSLITIYLDENGNPVDRRKRQVYPSFPQPVLSTQLVETVGDSLEDQSEVEILSSFVETHVDPKSSEALEQCSQKTVTVTVIKTCLP